MAEKVKLLLAGTVVSLFIALTTAYFSNFTTKAESAEMSKEVALLKSDIRHIKESVDEIKSMLKK